MKNYFSLPSSRSIETRVIYNNEAVKFKACTYIDDLYMISIVSLIEIFIAWRASCERALGERNSTLTLWMFGLCKSRSFHWNVTSISCVSWVTHVAYYCGSDVRATCESLIDGIACATVSPSVCVISIFMFFSFYPCFPRSANNEENVSQLCAPTFTHGKPDMCVWGRREKRQKVIVVPCADYTAKASLLNPNRHHKSHHWFVNVEKQLNNSFLQPRE